MFRFIHTADWQLGARFSQFGAIGRRLRESRLSTLAKALALARQHAADAFLIAGDLFEDNQVDDSLVAHMKAADFLTLLKSDFDLTLRLLRLLTAKSRGLSDRMFELIALTARDRLCGELARLAAEGTKEGTSILIRPAPTHYEFAARIGSHREAVTRELNQLAARGLLRLGRRHIVILDAARFSREMLGGDHEA